MRALTYMEVNQVNGGELYGGECNVELASYVVATAGVAVAAGPLGWGLFAAGWALAAYGMQNCASGYYSNC